MKSDLLKKTIGILVVLVSLPVLGAGQENHYVYTDGLLKNTSAKGWIKEFLNRQKSGMTGNPDALSYPYNTCLWDGEIARNRNYGRDWWRYEQTAYYTDGLLRLGYILDDRELVDKGEAAAEEGAECRADDSENQETCIAEERAEEETAADKTCGAGCAGVR